MGSGSSAAKSGDAKYGEASGANLKPDAGGGPEGAVERNRLDRPALDQNLDNEDESSNKAVDIEEVVKQLQSEGINYDRMMLAEMFQARSVLSPNDARMILGQARLIPPLRSLLSQYTEQGWMKKDALQLFLKTEQMEENITNRSVEKFVRNHKDYEGITHENIKTIHPVVIQDILFTNYNFIVSTTENTINQDMSSPLTDYFIFGSCSTFFLSAKFKAQLEIEAKLQAEAARRDAMRARSPKKPVEEKEPVKPQDRFKKATKMVMMINSIQPVTIMPIEEQQSPREEPKKDILIIERKMSVVDVHWAAGHIIDLLKTGIRFLEIDCWDGDEEPVVYKQYGVYNLTARELFQSIVKFAWMSSDYPFILSLDVRCDRLQQKQLAKHIIEVFGGHLAPSFPTKGGVPTPQSLRRKLLIECIYRLKTNEIVPGDTSTATTNSSDGATNGQAPVSDSNTPASGDSADNIGSRRISLVNRRRSLLAQAKPLRSTSSGLLKVEEKPYSSSIILPTLAPTPPGSLAAIGAQPITPNPESNRVHDKRHTFSEGLRVEITQTAETAAANLPGSLPPENKTLDTPSRQTGFAHRRSSVANRRQSITSNSASDQSWSAKSKSEYDIPVVMQRPHTTLLGSGVLRLDPDLMKIMHFERLQKSRHMILSGNDLDLQLNMTTFFNWSEFQTRDQSKFDANMTKRFIGGISDLAAEDIIIPSPANPSGIVSDPVLKEPDLKINIKIQDGDALHVWKAGCQMILSDLDTDRDLSWNIISMFSGNGKCGYILKPASLRKYKPGPQGSVNSNGFDINEVLSNIARHQKKRESSNRSTQEIKQEPTIVKSDEIQLKDLEEGDEDIGAGVGSGNGLKSPQPEDAKSPKDAHEKVDNHNSKGDKDKNRDAGETTRQTISKVAPDGVWMNRVQARSTKIDKNSLTRFSIWVVGTKFVSSSYPPVCELCVIVGDQTFSYLSGSATSHGALFYWDQCFVEMLQAFNLNEKFCRIVIKLWDPKTNETVAMQKGNVYISPQWSKIGQAVLMVDYLRCGLRCIPLRQSPRTREESGRVLIGLEYS